MLNKSYGSRQIRNIVYADERITIEKIISYGELSLKKQTYRHKFCEVLSVLQGELIIGFKNGDYITVKQGEIVSISAMTKYNIEATTSEPPCIWMLIQIKA